MAGKQPNDVPDVERARALGRQAEQERDDASIAPFYKMMRAAGYEPETFTVMRSEQIFQPEPSFIERFESLATLDPALYNPDEEFIEHNDLVYYRYSDGQFHLHPTKIYNYLAREGLPGERLESLEQGARELLVTLPNGGLAFYYPKTFTVQRMIGGPYRYSSIAQGAIIQAYLDLHQRYPDKDYLEMAERIYLSMEFPYERGGIGLSDSALLEFPSYGSVPEIILNGWIDALVHIRNYAGYSEDEDAQALMGSQLGFLADILPCFDAPSLRLSRYSDVSPFLFTLSSPRLDRNGIVTATSQEKALGELVDKNQITTEPLRIILLHTPKVNNLKSYAYFLTSQESAKEPARATRKSMYENHITSLESQKATFYGNPSRLYDTVILVNAPDAKLGYVAGKYDAKATVPKKSDPAAEILITGKPVERFTMFDFDETTVDETLGYPTNFKKRGMENFYHVYHAVALIALSETVEDPDIKRDLASWGLKWHEYTLNNPYEAEGQYANVNKVWDVLKKAYPESIAPRSYVDMVAGARSIVDS